MIDCAQAKSVSLIEGQLKLRGELHLLSRQSKRPCCQVSLSVLLIEHMRFADYVPLIVRAHDQLRIVAFEVLLTYACKVFWSAMSAPNDMRMIRLGPIRDGALRDDRGGKSRRVGKGVPANSNITRLQRLKGEDEAVGVVDGSSIGEIITRRRIQPPTVVRHVGRCKAVHIDAARLVIPVPSGCDFQAMGSRRLQPWSPADGARDSTQWCTLG